MRLRQRDLKPYTIKPRIKGQEPDGTTYEDWGTPSIIKGNLQPSGGKVMAEMYGERLAYMMTMYVETGALIAESDGVHVYAKPDVEPDYKVMAVRPWGAHKVVDLEKVTA